MVLRRLLSVLLLATASAHAVVLSDFSNLDAAGPVFTPTWTDGIDAQYFQDSGFISITAVGGGNPTDDGDFTVALPGDFTGLTEISIRARVDAGNEAATFLVVLLDTSGSFAAAQFSTVDFGVGFTTVNATLVPSAFPTPFDFSAVAGWGIAGGNDGSSDMRISIDELSAIAVPEPAALGLLVLGGVALLGRRRFARR